MTKISWRYDISNHLIFVPGTLKLRYCFLSAFECVFGRISARGAVRFEKFRSEPEYRLELPKSTADHTPAFPNESQGIAWPVRREQVQLQGLQLWIHISHLPVQFPIPRLIVLHGWWVQSALKFDPLLGLCQALPVRGQNGPRNNDSLVQSLPNCRTPTLQTQHRLQVSVIPKTQRIVRLCFNCFRKRLWLFENLDHPRNLQNNGR